MTSNQSPNGNPKPVYDNRGRQQTSDNPSGAPLRPDEIAAANAESEKENDSVSKKETNTAK